MAGAFETFKFWYAKSIAVNTYAGADATVKISDSSTPTGEEIKLIYCNPQLFSKRQTDVSNAIAVDPSAPDTGTGASNVVLRFTQNRKVAVTVPILAKLLAMFYLKGNDASFHSGRFGLENTDNPQLDCLPVANAGYKLTSFRQEPNQDNPSIQIWELTLTFLGDNTKLGTRT